MGNEKPHQKNNGGPFQESGGFPWTKEAARLTIFKRNEQYEFSEIWQLEIKPD